jgi:hypothetical protein
MIPRKLLILQYAKLAQMAKTANLSYTFLTLSAFEPAHLSMSTAADIALSLLFETMSIVSGLDVRFKLEFEVIRVLAV